MSQELEPLPTAACWWDRTGECCCAQHPAEDLQRMDLQPGEQEGRPEMPGGGNRIPFTGPEAISQHHKHSFSMWPLSALSGH